MISNCHRPNEIEVLWEKKDGSGVHDIGLYIPMNEHWLGYRHYNSHIKIPMGLIYHTFLRIPTNQISCTFWKYKLNRSLTINKCKYMKYSMLNKIVSEKVEDLNEDVFIHMFQMFFLIRPYVCTLFYHTFVTFSYILKSA